MFSEESSSRRRVPTWYLQFFCLFLQACCCCDALVSSCNFPSNVLDFLRTHNVQWSETSVPNAWEPNKRSSSRSSVFITLSNGDEMDDEPKLILHLIPTPTHLDECLPSNAKKKMTDDLLATQQNNKKMPKKIAHLHQDVWMAKTSIVQHRLLAQLGRSQQRIFARKTTSQRINATVAMEFLDQHHLWGATRAKCYYGLFDSTSGDIVAVAAFSARRKMIRHDKPHRSHELLRFCARRDATVVGGISKLLKAFIKDQSPDDIVTVVDRDWGDGSGWHTTGFETVHAMAPIVMVINPDEPGVRRHLVGAGIQSTAASSASSGGKENLKSGRMGLPLKVLDELKGSAACAESLAILSKHNFYQIHGRFGSCWFCPKEAKSMAALVLAGFAPKKQQHAQNPLRVLHMGLGGGTLPRFLADLVSSSEHVAVELDLGVVAAAALLPEHPRIRIVAGDAIKYRRDSSSEDPFDCVCVDVFDENNVLPPTFCSSSFFFGPCQIESIGSQWFRSLQLSYRWKEARHPACGCKTLFCKGIFLFLHCGFHR